MIHVRIPYSIDKRLGVAYNKEMASIPDDDWMCFIDHDVLFLLPETIRHLHEYVAQNEKAGILTCYGSRMHKGSKEQFLKQSDSDIKTQIQIAETQTKLLYKTTEIKDYLKLSGFLMLISKKMWNQVKFNENRGCLWVDTDFACAVYDAGKKIVRMDGIYVWHTYRLNKNVEDKLHLL